MRHLLLCLALAAASHNAWAGDVDLKISFEGFEPSGDLDQKVRSVLTRMHAWHEDVLGLSFGSRLPVHIRIIADRDAYNAEAAAVLHHSESTLGFFSSRSGGVIWRNPDESQMLSTLVHEAQHYLMAEGSTRGAPWLREGLAEVFERFRVSGNAVWLDIDSRALAWVASEQRAGSFDANYLFTTDSSAWSGFDLTPLGDANRTAGWAMTAFLMGTPHGRATLKAMVYAGDNGARVVAAADAHYPGGMRQLDREWQAWCTGRPKPLQLSIRSAQVEMTQRPTCDGIEMRKGNVVTCVK